MKHDYSKLEDKVVNTGTDISTTTNRTGPLIYTSLFFLSCKPNSWTKLLVCFCFK